MSLQSLLDEFKGRSLLDTKIISLPSPIMLELLEMKGKDRNEEEERHYQTLLKNCPRLKIKCYCADDMSSITADQINVLLDMNAFNTQAPKDRYYVSKDYKQKRTTPNLDWESLREDLKKYAENRSFTAIRTHMPTERDMQVHSALNMSSVTNGIYPRINYPLFKTTATAENEHD